MPSTTTPTRTPTTRLTRLVAVTAGLGLIVGAAALGETSAAAATPTVNAQSVGRFLDGLAGGTPIQQLADVKDARAKNPGSVTDQNPLDAKLFNSLDLPLTGTLQLPQLLGITLGAANQVAVAKATGYSYGASGAVDNSGGVSVGGNNHAYPADATIDLTPSGVAGNSPLPIPVPGANGTAAPLGGVTATIGAVSALAGTPGVTGASTRSYQIADLKLNLGSPLLGQTLVQLIDQINAGSATLSQSLTGPLQGLGVNLPADCSLSTVALNNSNPALSLDGGAVQLSLNSGNAGIAIDVDALLRTLNLDLNQLPANTDVIDYVVDYLTSAKGLSAGLQNLVNGLINPLSAQFQACSTALNAIPVLGPLLTQLISTLTDGQNQLESTVNTVVTSLTDGFSNVGGQSSSQLFAPLTDGLKQLVDIGANVQAGPGAVAGSFHTGLAATPDQATAPVRHQSLERAIEVKVGGGALDLALANAAAGPSAATAAPTSTPTNSPTTATPHPTGTDTNIPTAIPAGRGTTSNPALPITLVVLGVLTAGAGVFSRRLKLGRHGG